MNKAVISFEDAREAWEEGVTPQDSLTGLLAVLEDTGVLFRYDDMLEGRVDGTKPLMHFCAFIHLSVKHTHTHKHKQTHTYN